MAKNKKVAQNQQLMYAVVIVFAVVGVVVFLLALSTGTDYRSRADGGKPPPPSPRTTFTLPSGNFFRGSGQPAASKPPPPPPGTSIRPFSSIGPR